MVRTYNTRYESYPFGNVNKARSVPYARSSYWYDIDKALERSKSGVQEARRKYVGKTYHTKYKKKGNRKYREA